MTIPQAIKDKWQELGSHGDIQKIADASGLSYQTVWSALKSGECSVNTFNAIAEFYAEREEMFREYLD